MSYGNETDETQYRMYRAITGWLEKIYHLLNPDKEGERDVRAFGLRNKEEPSVELIQARGDIQLMIDLSVDENYKKVANNIKMVLNRYMDSHGRLPLSYEDFEDFVMTTPEKDKFGIKVAGADMPEIVHGAPERGRKTKGVKKKLGDGLYDGDETS